MTFEMLFGNVPFYSEFGREKMEKKIIAAKLVFPDRKEYPDRKYTDQVEDFIRQMLKKDKS